MLYKTPLSNYLVNLVGSHDTIRLKTFIKNESLHYLSLALTLMFDGMPLIYYGDEIGLEGDVDPDNRRAFRWEDTSKKELAMIKQLGSLRNKFQALKKGKIKPIFTDDRVIAFTRKYQDEEITVVINFSESEKILQIAGTDILYGQAKLHNQEILIDSLSIIIIK
jgi:alpha-glucosidase